jgi:hypothetical protein
VALLDIFRPLKFCLFQNNLQIFPQTKKPLIMSADTTGGENIRVFGRLKPENVNKSQLAMAASNKRPNFSYTLDQQPDATISDEDDLLPQLHIAMNKDDSQGLVNNSRERFDFRFTRLFDQSTTQEEVFDNVAKGVVDSVLDGYNGTIFAYGQVPQTLSLLNGGFI